jgi:hypothetical protein
VTNVVEGQRGHLRGILPERTATEVRQQLF